MNFEKQKSFECRQICLNLNHVRTLVPEGTRVRTYDGVESNLRVKREISIQLEQRNRRAGGHT